VLRESAGLRWKKRKCVYMENILDMKPNQLSCVIGTIFKEQSKKRNVFQNIEGVIENVNAIECSTDPEKIYGKFVSENDLAVLEDASGRINIKETEHFSPSNFTTGSIVALLGYVDNAGLFACEDHCFAGILYRPELPKHISFKKQSLFESLENRKFVMFTSGLNFGSQDLETITCLKNLSQMLQGQSPNS
jgi:hypothetical protein